MELTLQEHLTDLRQLLPVRFVQVAVGFDGYDYQRRQFLRGALEAQSGVDRISDYHALKPFFRSDVPHYYIPVVKSRYRSEAA